MYNGSMDRTSDTPVQQSFLSKLYESLFYANQKLGVINPKENLESFLEGKRAYQAKPYALPRLLMLHSTMTLEMIEGMPTVIFSPKSGEAEKFMIYFHGGAYVDDPSPLHFHFIDSMLKHIPLTVYMPVYPKTPTYTATDLFPRMEKVMKDIMGREHEQMIIAGDSAGGGLALAITSLMNLKPVQLILISPWLDLHLMNPEIVELEDQDPLLSREYLRAIGALYKGYLAWDDPHVSPKDVTIEKGIELTLFVGTHEIFLADVRAFAMRMKKEGFCVHYVEKKGMNHDYALFPMKEGSEALLRIVRIIT